MEQYQAHDIIKQLYFSGQSFNNNEEILDKYASPEEGIGQPLEFPDRISNVNGTHLYKLLSAKDINFNNVLLPNSIVPDTNWGSFDESRRWPSGYPIYINDVYELMNVVDYLLCATEDLWSEINKLKYGSDVINNLWFINNLQGEINQIYEINSAQFQQGSNYAINLNPRTYFATVPTSTMQYFGIATHFFDVDHTPIVRRVIKSDNNKRSGIIGYITYEDRNDYFTQKNENINGTITSIYGYLIGTDLHFYPMFNIDNFFRSAKDGVNNFNNLVDFSKMKLKYDLYFRVANNTNNKSTFEKLHIDFLYKDWEDVGHPYILYYIDSSNQRRIVYIHTEAGDNNKTVQQISQDLQPYSEYINYFYDTTTSFGRLDEFGDQLEVYEVNEGAQYPYLYHITDSSRLNLFVQTPNTDNFSLTQNTLPINYFKSNNSLNAIIRMESGKMIESSEDHEQDQGLLYSPTRYNVPDNNNIKVEVTGTFLNNNPQILYDDEFTDVLIQSDGSGNYVNSDEEAKKYYYYNGLDSNTNKRIFTRFNSKAELNSFFVSDSNPNAININDIDNIKCGHVYIKNEDAYKLNYKFTTNSLINQITDYSRVIREVEQIENTSRLTKTIDLHTLSFNYDLPEDIEQLKFDLNLSVDETSKVTSSELNIPISLNKIHQPCIQFISRNIIQQELKEYDNHLAYTFGDKPNDAGITVSENYMYTNRVNNDFLTTSNGRKKTNQNLIQGDNVEDQFSTFTELYTYVLERKYNNFEKTDVNGIIRTDILNHIDSGARHSSITINNIKLEDTFNLEYTYDNTVNNMRKLIIAYHPEKTMLNLIGGDMFDDYLRSINSTLVDKQSIAYFDNVTYSPELNKSEYIQFKNIFNINGLGFNYRLHGGDSYLYINKDGSNVGAHTSTTDLPFDNQYNLLANSCNNTQNNICKFLEISLTDNDNQIEDITKIGNELSGEETELISNDILDIHLTSYTTRVQCDYFRLSTPGIGITENLSNRRNLTGFTTTYYVPITYMVTKSTTFYPTKNILPEYSSDKQNYDLTNTNDVNRYKQYIQYWDSENESTKYKPITMTLQLKENLSNNTPFFYESNKAKLCFDIRRINPKKLDDTNNSKYNPYGKTINLAIGQRYYLADMINVDQPPIQLNSIGSYPKYNATTSKYEIIDIYKNTLDGTDTYPIPIFYTNNNYQYEIEKCAILNKIDFERATFNGNQVSNSLIDLDLYWLDTDMNLLENISNQVILSDAGISLEISGTKVLGNKLYQNNNTTSHPNITVKFINRTKPSKSSQTIEIIDQTYDPQVNNIITTNGVEQFNFYNYVEGAAPELQVFKHFEFYSLTDNMELFEIPPYSRLGSMYIYDRLGKRMNCLGTMQKYNNGEINKKSYFNDLYNDLLQAFISNKIYERIS